MEMNDKEKKIIGTILYLVQDKRKHIMYRDCLSWMETKMEEIERLALMLPYISYKKIKKNDKDMKDVRIQKEDGYMDVLKTEYISTLQNMEWEIEDIILDQKLGLKDGQREYLRQVIGDIFHKVLYDGEMLNLDEEQKAHLEKVLKVLK